MKGLRKFPYWYLIVVPLLLIVLGVSSNQAVLVANHGKFPVMMNDAWMQKFCSLEGVDPDVAADIPSVSCAKGGQMLDDVHSVMGPNSHLKLMADIFPLGKAIYSIGDGFIELGSWLLTFTPLAWLFLTVRKMSSLVP